MKKENVIIITGAGGDLGNALAWEAVSKGFAVALVGRTRSKLLKLASELERQKKYKALVTVHAFDLSDEKATHRAFKEIKKTHGPIRALVNNAATWMGSTNLNDLKVSEIRRSLDLNFFSSVHASLAVLKLRKQASDSDLAIINIGATASLDAWMEVVPFSIAKGALRSFSRALARDAGPKGVHVAHLVIDGMLGGKRTRALNPELPDNRFLDPKVVSENILQVILQKRSAWTQEWDVRPYNENW